MAKAMAMDKIITTTGIATYMNNKVTRARSKVNMDKWA